jgi:tetratricopeptide (TPR) repeat protein
LPDDLERMAAWVEVITGLRLDKQQGLIQVLDNAAWLERRERLTQLGGPPETGRDQRLDPILFGPDPTARAESFIERKQWDAAEAAFDEAARARPFNLSIILQRGDLYAKRGLWREAAAYYATTVRKYPDLAPLHEQLALTRFLAGDLPGYQSACGEMVEHFKPIDDSTDAVRVAYVCSLAPAAVTDLPGLIQVSERSTRWVASNERVVGAVLFRAGRVDDALKRFDTARKVYQPRAWDWLFLAMIHSRLGHPDESRQMLARADDWIANADHQSKPGIDRQGQSEWGDACEKPTTLLLRREAEAIVRSDPELPGHPFAHGASGPPSGATR